MRVGPDLTLCLIIINIGKLNLQASASLFPSSVFNYFDETDTKFGEQVDASLFFFSYIF
jgi:hypothetical protein